MFETAGLCAVDISKWGGVRSDGCGRGISQRESTGSHPLVEPQSKPGQVKVSKEQSQPEIAAAAVLILYMVLGRPLQYRALIDYNYDSV